MNFLYPFDTKRSYLAPKIVLVYLSYERNINYAVLLQLPFTFKEENISRRINSLLGASYHAHDNGSYLALIDGVPLNDYARVYTRSLRTLRFPEIYWVDFALEDAHYSSLNRRR